VSFGLTFDKLLIIGLIAVFLIGPDRLPHYAAQLARLVRGVRDMANGAKDRMREEMGPEFDEVDWKKLDPRQYDPRRIIREALIEDEPAGPPPPRPSGSPTRTGTEADAAASTAAAVAGSRPRYIESAYEARQRKLGKGRPAPFDSEAT
jgi:sec-independent protein translocase protein TatB